MLLHIVRGIGNNILLARLATKKAKPNGQFHLTSSLVEEHLAQLPVKELPGIGWSMAAKLSDKVEERKLVVILYFHIHLTMKCLEH